MSSRGKKKTTMAKLSRESRLRERRLDKQARKDARKNAPAQPDQPEDMLEATIGDPALSAAEQPDLEAVAHPVEVSRVTVG